MTRSPAPPKAHRAPDTEARRGEQRRRLLQAAQRAIHRDGPQASMDDIAAEAGITKPIVYRHFGDRRGLAIALRDTAFGAMLATPSGDAGRDRELARERIASFYPVVSDAGHLRRVLVGWATSFQMFVAMNRNLYRFLRAEGVLESVFEDRDGDDPLTVSLAASLREVFGRRIDERTATLWAQAARSMLGGLVDWTSRRDDVDRFELEAQFDVLAGALLDGLGRSLLPATAGKPAAARRPRALAPSVKRKR